MIQSEDSPSSRVFNEQNSLNTQTSRQDVTVQLGTICVSYGQIMTISLKKKRARISLAVAKASARPLFYSKPFIYISTKKWIF